jgi:hypothetical protein
MLPSTFGVSTNVSEQSGSSRMIKTHNVSQLCLSHQVLSLSSNQLLLKRDQLRALWLLYLQFGNLIVYFGLAVSTRLDTLLRISDGFQDCSRIIQVVCVEILRLAQLTEQNPNFVGDVRDGIIIRSLAPIRELAGNRDALLACGLVVPDQVVLRFDELEEPFGEFGLDAATQRAEAETVFFGGSGGDLVLVGADGECSIPNTTQTISLLSGKEMHLKADRILTSAS